MYVCWSIGKNGFHPNNCRSNGRQSVINNTIANSFFFFNFIFAVWNKFRIHVKWVEVNINHTHQKRILIWKLIFKKHMCWYLFVMFRAKPNHLDHERIVHNQIENDWRKLTDLKATVIRKNTPSYLFLVLISFLQDREKKMRAANSQNTKKQLNNRRSHVLNDLKWRMKKKKKQIIRMANPFEQQTLVNAKRYKCRTMKYELILK